MVYISAPRSEAARFSASPGGPLCPAYRRHPCPARQPPILSRGTAHAEPGSVAIIGQSAHDLRHDRQIIANATKRKFGCVQMRYLGVFVGNAMQYAQLLFEIPINSTSGGQNSYLLACFALGSSPPKLTLISTGPVLPSSLSVYLTPSPMSCLRAKIARAVI